MALYKSFGKTIYLLRWKVPELYKILSKVRCSSMNNFQECGQLSFQGFVPKSNYET